MAQFTVTLASNSALDVYKNNTLASFRTYFPVPIELSGKWEAALVDITYPRHLFNIDNCQFDFWWHRTGGWICNCSFRKGSYATIKDVINEINRAIDAEMMTAVTGNYKRYEYIKYTIDDRGRFQIDESRGSVRFANMSEDLFTILGCAKHESGYKPKRSDGMIDQPGIHPVDIHRWHQIFVYADFIEQQFVGNAKAPLLKSFPLYNPQHVPPEAVEKTPGGVLGYGVCSFGSFDGPTFKPVCKSIITDIMIQLRTETGILVPFVGTGRSMVTVLFRQTMS